MDITDSVDLAISRKRVSTEVAKIEQLKASYGSSLFEEKEEEGVKYSVYQMSRTINCALRELVSIPAFIGQHYGDWLVRLDLSYNNILSIKGIDQCRTLEELVLNCNQITDEGFYFATVMPNMTSLVLNNNQLTDLRHFLDQTKVNLPNLAFLSVHGNPICHDSLLAHNEDEEEDYERYRLTVIHDLTSLKFLDSRPVGENELQEAVKRGNFLANVAKPRTSDLDKSAGHPQRDFSPGKPLPETKNYQNNKPRNPIAAPTRHHYKGNHSEGNRFITDNHL